MLLCYRDNIIDNIRALKKSKNIMQSSKFDLESKLTILVQCNYTCCEKCLWTMR